ncbi:MAG: YlmC/YmxH family sporulation protein [Lachnospiraceae bacterium]|jgi:YlmC/YmxH family sporulation protein|nr:YlmC/YmxH family sporulation protein [Lachnospiraceae bacterium]
MRLYDLKDKEVINACDCRRLGFVSDVVFEFPGGNIIAFIVPGPGHICGIFGRDTEYVIPFRCVRQIGNDIILVEVKVEEILQKCEGF